MNRLASTGTVNRPKPMAANAMITVLSVRICHSRANAASTEIGAGLLVLDDLAEHVLLLELAAWRLLQPEREDASDRRRDAEQQEGHRQPSSPPASAAMPADERRAECRRRRAAGHRSRRADPPADRRSGRCRRSCEAVDRDRAGLRHADAEAGPEQLERVGDKTARGHADRRTRGSPMPMIGGRLKRSASQPIGSAPSTRKAPDAPREEHDHAVAHTERVADVRAPAPRASRPRALRASQHQQHDEGGRPSCRDPLAQASSARRRRRGAGRPRRAPARLPPLAAPRARPRRRAPRPRAALPLRRHVGPGSPRRVAHAVAATWPWRRLPRPARCRSRSLSSPGRIERGTQAARRHASSGRT